MNKLFGRTAFNAVYFFVAVSCSFWFFKTYGLHSNAAIAVCGVGLFYAVLLCASLGERSLRTTLFSPRELSATSRKSIRSICLLLPALALTYIATFYLFALTYCSPGGADRLENFSVAEEAIFQKSHIGLQNPALEKKLKAHVDATLSPWVKSHWHPPSCCNSMSALCNFRVYKNGEIVDVKVKKSSGDAAFDRECVATLDSVAPPLPSFAPDWVEIDFTLDYNVHTAKEAAAIDEWGDESFRIGEEARFNGRYAKAVKEFSQCLAIRRTIAKSGSTDLIDVYLSLADTYSSMGLKKQSTHFFDEAIACAEKGKPLSLSRALVRYAKDSYEEQKFAKTFQLYERAQKLDSTAFSREDRVRFAQSLYVTGQRDRALKEFAIIFDSDKQGPLGTDVLRFEREGLIKLYLKAGNEKAALDLMQSALVDAGTSGKKSQKLRSELLFDFSDAYHQMGESVERNYLQSVLKEFTTNFGALDPKTVRIRSSLASFEADHGNKKLADDLYRQLVNKFGKNDPDRANALFHQAAYYFEKKHDKQSELAMREVVESRTRFYKRDDNRVLSAKEGLALVLRTEGKSKEADSLTATVAVPNNSDRESVLNRLLKKYQDSGKSDKALAVLDELIKESWKVDPEDSHGIRIYTYYAGAIEICRKNKYDKRLEEYLKGAFASEIKRLGYASRRDLVEFYLERNNLSKAEQLAHEEIEDCLHGCRDTFARFDAENTSRAFVLLAQVKDSQQRKASARYYLERAVAVVEPNGRSDQHAETVGLLAQYIAAQGDLVGAKELLVNLLDNQLTDTAGGVCFDPIGEFNSSGFFSSSGAEEFTYMERGSERCDPSMHPNGSFELPYRQELPLAMSSVDWSAGLRNESDFCYLKAAASIALASIEEKLGEKENVAASRQLVLDSIQQFVEACEIWPNYRSYDVYDQVFGKLPPSKRLKELRARFDTAKSSPRLI